MIEKAKQPEKQYKKEDYTSDLTVFRYNYMHVSVLLSSIYSIKLPPQRHRRESQKSISLSSFALCYQCVQTLISFINYNYSHRLCTYSGVPSELPPSRSWCLTVTTFCAKLDNFQHVSIREMIAGFLQVYSPTVLNFKRSLQWITTCVF